MSREKTGASPAAGYSRRALLAGAAAAAAVTSLPAEAQAKRKRSPNDRVNVAMIGAGGKGAGNAMAILSENVVAAAGTVHYLTLEQMKDAIRELGYTPRRRNVFYELVDDAPLEPAAA